MKAIFGSSVSEAEVLRQFAETNKEESYPVAFKEVLPAAMEYRVYMKDGTLVFQLLQNETDKLAEFIIKDNGKGFEIQHRLVQSQDQGISGTDFLKKTEGYFRILMEKQLIPRKPLLLDVGQKEVLEWALKNGFTFEDPAEAQTYATLHEHPELRTDITDTTDPEMTKSGYIMSQNAYEQWADENTRRAAKGEKLVPAQNASLRFHLKKDL